MLIDTHCHLNMMIKKTSDTPLTPDQVKAALCIADQARHETVTRIINVGTSLAESKNCITLALNSPDIWAAVGIHPNDCTLQWREDMHEIKQWLKHASEKKIVALGECGLDFHYPDYNIQRQKDAFRMHIELALTHDLALIIHTRDAREETARIMEEFKGDVQHGVVHCFSEDIDFATYAIELGYALGIGATITYPKNNHLRTIVTEVPLESIVLETDAPFLPPQDMRGHQNHPRAIVKIAEYVAQLRGISSEEVTHRTTQRANAIFRLPCSQ